MDQPIQGGVVHHRIWKEWEPVLRRATTGDDDDDDGGFQMTLCTVA